MLTFALVVEEFLFFFYLNIQPMVPSPGYKIIMPSVFLITSIFSAGIQIKNKALVFHGILQDSPVSETDTNNCGLPNGTSIVHGY